MGKNQGFMGVGLAVVALGLFFVFGMSWADGKGRTKRGHDEKSERSENHKNKRKAALITATDATFIQTCGSCHLAYAPDLLPLASWKNILNHPENHFGEELVIDPNDLLKIMSYIEHNAADKMNTELSKKIMRINGRNLLMRITDVPYIKAKHKKQKLVPDCTVCHK